MSFRNPKTVNDHTQKINALQTLANQYGIYLCGEYAQNQRLNLPQLRKSNLIEFLVERDGNFDVNLFYQQLKSFIPINQEFENSSSRYTILSDGYILDFRYINPGDISSFEIFRSSLSADHIVFDLKHQSFINDHDLKSLPVNLTVTKSENWNIADLLGIVYTFGLIDSDIDDVTFRHITNRDIYDYPLDIYTTTSDLITKILLTFHPGAALRFLVENVPNSKKWLFARIIDILINLNIQIRDDISVNDIFADYRLDLIDVYNEFLLSSKQRPELPSEKKNRLSTTLRLLFNSPDLNIPTPYIDSVSVMSASLEDNDVQENVQKRSFSLFDLQPGCPYGPCPECQPENCDPQCCCCHSVDILSAATIRCHKKAVLSCNKDGTGPAPGESFGSCEDCRLACKTILGLRPELPSDTSCANFVSVGQTEGWWHIPGSNWPCECTCSQHDGDECNLTCVTCADMYCTSVPDVVGNDCNYNITLSPGDDCCGNTRYQDVVFVSDWYEPDGVTWNGYPYMIGFIRAIVSSMRSIALNIRFGLVTFNDSNPSSDSRLTRKVIDLTTPDNFLSQLPSTMASTGGSDIPNTQWYAVVRAIDEFDWQGQSKLIMGMGSRRHSGYGGDVGPPIPALCSGFDQGLGACFGRAIASMISGNFTFGDFAREPVDPTLEPGSANYFGTSSQLSYLYEMVNVCSDGYRTLWPSTTLVEPFSSDPGAVCADTMAVGYPSSCNCIDTTPIPIRRNSPECICCKEGSDPCVDDPFDHACISNLPESCFNIPIRKCLPSQSRSVTACNCELPITLNVCGNTIVVAPTRSNLVCCSDIGFGCECDTTTGETDCCGPMCHDLCTMYQLNPDIDALIDFVWNDCWTKKAGIDISATPNCTDPCCPDQSNIDGNNYPCELLDPGSSKPCCPCLLENQSDCCNCCIKFLDETGVPSISYCRSEIAQQVREAVKQCSVTVPPPAPWDPPNIVCREDKCIVGEPVITDNAPVDKQCENKYIGCTALKHPSCVVLNNGIGLVAYEAISNGNSTIKVQQFNTSLGNKILPNREFNFGRLQNKSKWVGGIAKLYIYDPPIEHLMSGTSDPSQSSAWKDAIAFKTGPLAKQFFPLATPSIGTDSAGTFIRFYFTSTSSLTTPFPSPDDVYDVKFFIFDFEDTGVIGDAVDNTTAAKEFDIEDRATVDQALFLSPHIYNGQQVPVAYPSIATAYNYSEPLENANFVYLAYQAFENSKWNIYLRQLRLSEYKHEEQTSDAIENNNIVTVASLGVADVVYRIMCVSDNCTAAADGYILRRNIVFEVLLRDGRDVLNPGLDGDWHSLCPGYAASEFPKEKIFVQFVHSVVSDRCPDQFGMDEIFYNWQTGQEFDVPAASISAEALFQIIRLPNDSAIELGVFDPPITAASASISSSSVGAVWYQDFAETDWSVISNTAFDTLKSIKGLDISEPILLTRNEVGHCTKPVVKINYNNDVYVLYETTEVGTTQIKITGTSAPSSSLPVGVLNPKDPDETLDYFLGPKDFKYSAPITLADDGINKSPDMFIDLNDVVHITWASNRDQRWEIYYANSENNFSHKRITNFSGRSLEPSIDGDNLGRIFIAWHDNRFGSHEIMMAYYPGIRILPLAQQDPYLATIRNTNYRHYVNEVPLLLTNSTDDAICVRNLIVDFYKDRTLSQLAFEVKQADSPFAFISKTAQSDQTSYSFSDFSWTEEVASATSDEFDTFLAGSSIIRVMIDFDVFDSTNPPIEIAFAASDTSGDTLNQTSGWAAIRDVGLYEYPELSIDGVQGRYKRVFMKFYFSTTQPTINALSIVSGVMSRICIAPNSTDTVYFDATPRLRIDEFGNETSEFPIPIGFGRNQTYFTRVRAITDDNRTITMPDQLTSFSCESCTGKTSSWDLASCSIKVLVKNNTSETRYYNFRFVFYYDPEKQRRISSFDVFFGEGDLRYVTVDGVSGETAWIDRGLEINPQESLDVILWPALSPTAGLLCGIEYYVDIYSCSMPTSSETPSCTTDDLVIFKHVTWKCSCESLRSDSAFDGTPVNLLEMTRWISSGDGFSDTRLTETINTNNLNPVIKMRSNLNGVIVYQTNRLESSNDPGRYKIYASVFSVQPGSNMYASGAEAITSSFENVFHQSDVPICENSAADKIGCYDDNHQRINETIIGENPALSLDQYDSLFLAAEKAFGNDCNATIKDQQSYIVVHTCGTDALDLFETSGSATKTDKCADKLFAQSFVQKDILKTETQVEARVLNKHVQYHIVKNHIAMAVVDNCNVQLEIIGASDTISIRIRNGDGNFSEWVDISPIIDKNSTVIDWTLTPGSGTKTVEFQCMTTNGVSHSGFINIIADYRKIGYTLSMYRAPATIDFPPAIPDINSSAIWTIDNLVSTFNDVPVTALRRPVIRDGNIYTPIRDYIFIEVVPDFSYMEQFASIGDEIKTSGNSGIEPTFDLLHQGSSDLYRQSMSWARRSDGKEVFRSYITLAQEDLDGFIDGTAQITLHFKNDCSDSNAISVSQQDFDKDVFNVMGADNSTNTDFMPDRDDVGFILYKSTVRPDEDPYLIFGDPDYRNQD